MDIYEKKDGGNLTLTVDGRLDAATAQVLERYFDRVKESINVLTLDFSLLKYISSAGLRTVIIMLKWLNGRGKRLSIINIPYEIRSVFETAGMIKLFVRDERFVILQRELTDVRAVYALAGMLDEKSLPQLETLLTKFENREISELVLDCAKVPVISREARELLENAQTRWQERSRVLSVVNLSAQVDRTAPVEKPPAAPLGKPVNR